MVHQDSPLRLVARLSLLLVVETAGCGAELPSAISARSPSQVVVNAPPMEFPKSDTQIAEQFSVPNPSPSEPVLVDMKFHPPFAGPGDATELIVCFRIARAHYVHASVDSGSPFSPIDIRVQFPKGLQAQGNWRYPQPETDKGGRHLFRDAVLLRCPIKVASDASASSFIVNGELSFQVCTDDLCWPPRSIDVSAPFTIQSRAR
jgi:hypothetical protein